MPSRRISNWHYVYVLQSQIDNNFYVGYTLNLRRRFDEHNAKKSFSTATRAPFTMIYVEACKNEHDAKRRERYLKTTQGRRFLKLRIRNFLKS
ncbi:MAG: GIY-YIG nuclease family protein [bacterium]|nr:GIY-YIG nuclease family protein [bacterium]